MSSPIVSTLFAKNEFSNSAVTTHSCFLLSNGQEMTRKLNIPNGWTSIRLTFKCALYSDPIPSADLASTRFVVGMCSENRTMGNLSNAHILGYFFGHDSLGIQPWNVNGGPAEGQPSGTLSTPFTNPPNCAWMAGPYGSRPFSLITGSLQNQGGGASQIYYPFYNTQWSSSYTASNGFPIYALAGFAWRTVSLEFTKNSATGSTTGFGNLRVLSNFSFFSNIGRYNSGINIPRTMVRRASISDQTSPFSDYFNWDEWYEDTTKTNEVGPFVEGDGVGMPINEVFFGPLNCVNFQWFNGTGVQMAVRDVSIVQIA